MAARSEFDALKARIPGDPLAARVFAELKRNAESILAEPPAQHKLVGPRMLDQSRAALRRISTLAGLYRLTGDRRYFERARSEMLAAASFPDWSPAHFLDLAEMTAAMGLGYDWLHAELSPEDRLEIRTAILDKGLREGLKVYAAPKGWPKARHNWNLVCNGGLVVGALAVAEDAPEIAGPILAAARESAPVALRSYAPDGGWAEGPGYWDYATLYGALLIASLESALGTDYALARSTGFPETGEYRVQFLGPDDRTFNFADASERAEASPQMFWLARRFEKPAYAAAERGFLERHGVGRNRLGFLALLWLEPEPAAPPAPPLDALFRGIDVAFFRGAWNDPSAVFVGFKGGDNEANHAHLDLGTFVLDAQGVRWAVDLGSDDYDLPGYFGDKRWTYYRLRTEGHNTLTLEGNANQDASARAPIVAFLSVSTRAFAVADLSEAYRPAASRALRGVALLDRRRVLLQDEIEAVEPVSPTWNFHTRAAIRIEDGGRRAVLSRGGKTLIARILSPAAARFAVAPAYAPPPQARQPEVSNLTIVSPEKARSTRIAVLLSGPGDDGPVSITPLTEWGGALN